MNTTSSLMCVIPHHIPLEVHRLPLNWIESCKDLDQNLLKRKHELSLYNNLFSIRKLLMRGLDLFLVRRSKYYKIIAKAKPWLNKNPNAKDKQHSTALWCIFSTCPSCLRSCLSLCLFSESQEQWKPKIKQKQQIKQKQGSI